MALTKEEKLANMARGKEEAKRIRDRDKRLESKLGKLKNPQPQEKKKIIEIKKKEKPKRIGLRDLTEDEKKFIQQLRDRKRVTYHKVVKEKPPVKEKLLAIEDIKPEEQIKINNIQVSPEIQEILKKIKAPLEIKNMIKKVLIQVKAPLALQYKQPEPVVAQEVREIIEKQTRAPLTLQYKPEPIVGESGIIVPYNNVEPLEELNKLVTNPTNPPITNGVLDDNQVEHLPGDEDNDYDDDIIQKITKNKTILESGTVQQKEKIKNAIMSELPVLAQKVKNGTATGPNRMRLNELHGSLKHLIDIYHQDKAQSLKLYAEIQEIKQDIKGTIKQEKDRIKIGKMAGEKMPNKPRTFTESAKKKTGLDKEDFNELVQRVKIAKGVTLREARTIVSKANKKITNM